MLAVGDFAILAESRQSARLSTVALHAELPEFSQKNHIHAPDADMARQNPNAWIVLEPWK